MNKPRIPRNVATAIEQLRSEGVTNFTLTNTAIHGGPGSECEVIRDYAQVHFNTFLAALINGYIVEKTAEELAEEERKAAYDSIRMSLTAARIARGSASDYYDGYDRGVKQTLGWLRIKIEGVNA